MSLQDTLITHFPIPPVHDAPLLSAALIALPILVGFAWGCVIGSFSVAAIMRIRSGVSPNAGRSRCGSCERELTAVDLVPVLSWLVLRGRCRTCKAALSWRYPAGEAAFGLIGAALIFYPVLLGAVTLVWILLLSLVGEVRSRRGFRR